MLQQLGPRRTALLAIMGVSLVIILVGTGLLLSGVLSPKATVTLTPTPRTVVTQAPSPSPTASNGTSSLLFGTNLGLNNGNDQTINSQPTQQLMQKIHVRIVRMPTGNGLNDAVIVAAAQMIKNINATPLIILTGTRHPDFVTHDTRIVTDMVQIFGDSPVYYELGNEDDFNGVPMTQYVQGWNTLVPTLKKIEPHAQFVGPVSYQYSRKNLTAFLQGANPQPDEISWHEYTCSYKRQADVCLANIDKWTTHITDANSVMRSTINKVLPIMITEWNYAPDQQIQSNGQAIPDGKIDNSDFITQWTTKAIQTLATNHVFASMQFAVTDTPIPMITPGNTLTTQGTVFQSMYEQMIGKS